MKIVFFGLSITSTWGNGHATTYRSLVRALSARKHEIIFLERDVEWYANQRDMADPPFCKLHLYKTLADLKRQFRADIRSADCIVIGSYVPDGVVVAEWVTRNAQGPIAFYDIDTPVTLAKLAKGDYEYLSPQLIPLFDLYLSFTGGPLLDRLATEFGARMVRPLFCSADPDLYYPQPGKKLWDLGYIGTYSADRHSQFERLLLAPAHLHSSGRFIVAGSQYPPEIQWPTNLVRISHLPWLRHREFYNLQRFTLNLTRGPMVKAGFSPSVRLFEAAACGTAIISDRWPGLETFFKPGKEILVAASTREILDIIKSEPEWRIRQIGKAARERFLEEHTPDDRAAEFESYVAELFARSRAPSNVA
ncbi:MAG: glycosyltransferase [Verrucomicrobia bacterium]|nr:glycosyltransferase [Verrucomicrobiota bacterium]